MGAGPFSALVLAGGAASRLGGSKAGRDVAGRPMLLRVLATARDFGAEVILLPGRRDLSAELRQGDALAAARSGSEATPRQVADWPGVEGPLAAVGAGLEAARHPWCALLPCDLPFASAAVLRDLAAEPGRPPVHAGAPAPLAVVLENAHGLQPFHSLVARDALPSLRAALARGEHSLRGWLAGLPVRRVRAERYACFDPELSFLLNVNTPADLVLARRRIPA